MRPPRWIPSHHYRVGAQGCDARYADKPGAFQAADDWEKASGNRVKVYRVDIAERWTPVRRRKGT